MVKKGGEKVLLVLRKTRKAFFIEYFCGIVLLLILLITYLKDIQLHFIVFYSVLALSLLCFISAEYARMMVRYRFTSSKLEIIDGIVKQNKKNVYFFSLRFIPDIDIEQSRIERIFNYGTIKLGTGENSFILREIDKPHLMIEKIEKLIESNKERQKTNMSP